MVAYFFESFSFLLISLPIIAFACLWCLATLPQRDWRIGFLKAAVVWGAITLVITELLSIFAAIHPVTLALAWVIVITTSVYLSRRQILEEGENGKVAVGQLFVLPAGERWWLVPIIPAAAIALTTAVIALIAPPNNWDSMTYHMSRVEHWRVNNSVSHYPTNIEWQLYLNPWAEFSILQFQTLGFGSDRLANLVQWFAFVGAMVAVSLLVRILGGARFAQGLGALVVATTPMVILQSTSTQNDVVCGFFVVAAVYFLFERLSLSSPQQDVYFPLSVALAIATKGTVYPILLPFIAYGFIGVIKQEGIRQGARLAGILMLAVLLLNVGHWARNLGLWQHPLGNPQWLAYYENQSFGVRETISNVVRNVALHLGTPSSKVDAFTESVVQKIHRVLGISINDPSLTFLPWAHIVPESRFLTHEDYAGNGVALLLSVLGVGAAMLTKAGRCVRPLALLLFMSGLLFCIFIKWSPWNSRLHTPLFLLAAVVVGRVLTPSRLAMPNGNEAWRRKIAVLLGIGLISSGLILNEWVIGWLFGPGGAVHSRPLRWGIWAVDGLMVGCGFLAMIRHRWYLRTLTAMIVSILTLAAFPWVGLNQLRPLISTQSAPSIFDRSRIEQMFANNIRLIAPYTELISVLVQRASCREIGLKIQIGAFEYPLWQIARHAGVDLVFHHVEISNESAGIARRSRQGSPCALAVIAYKEEWDPELSVLEKMDTIWSRPPIRLLFPRAAG